MVLFQLENGMISRSSGIRPSGNSRKLNGHLVILVTGVTGRFLPRLMLEIDSTLMLWDVPETDMKQSTVDCGNGGLWMVHTDMIGGSIILCFELSLSLNRSSLRMVRRLSKCSTTSIQLFSKNTYPFWCTIIMLTSFTSCCYSFSCFPRLIEISAPQRTQATLNITLSVTISVTCVRWGLLKFLSDLKEN